MASKKAVELLRSGTFKASTFVSPTARNLFRDMIQTNAVVDDTPAAVGGYFERQHKIPNQVRHRTRRVQPSKIKFDAKQDAQFGYWLKSIRWAEQAVSPSIYASINYPKSTFWIHEARKKGAADENEVPEEEAE